MDTHPSQVRTTPCLAGRAYHAATKQPAYLQRHPSANPNDPSLEGGAHNDMLHSRTAHKNATTETSRQPNENHRETNEYKRIGQKHGDLVGDT